MKILQILPYYAPAWGYGGPPRVMYNLACGLIAKGHKVTVYTTDAYKKDKRIDIQKNNFDGIEVLYFKNLSNKLAWEKKKFFPLGFRSHLKKTIENFDIVHISAVRNYMNMAAYPILKKSSIPYVIDAHGSLPVATGKLKRIAKIYDYFFVKPMLKNADLLFAQTENEANSYKSLNSKKENIKLMPLPIDLKDFQNLPEKEGFRKKYRIKTEEKVITFLGRINQGKGLDLLLDVFRKLIVLRSNFKLVIAGRDDGYLETVEKNVLKYNLSDKVNFTGPIYGEEKLKLYIDTDLFLFTPSYCEETSTASLEAMACYTPAIVTKQAQIPYLEDYQAGFCLDCANTSGIIEKILEIFSGDRQRIFASNARRLVEEKYDVNRVVEKIEDLFLQVITKN